MKKVMIGGLCVALATSIASIGSEVNVAKAETGQTALAHAPKLISDNTFEAPTRSARFVHQSGYHFGYPEEGVRVYS